MKARLSTINFLATIIIFTQMALSTNSVVLDAALSDGEPPAELFTSLGYFIVYILAWNILFEISLVIVVNYKQKPFYAAEHMTINVMVLITQAINNFLLFKRIGFDFSHWFVRIECILFAAEIVQLALGGMLNKKLQSEKLVKGIFILRFLHKNWGRLIYLVTKYQIAVYTVNFLWDSSVSPVIFLSLLFGLTVITHVTLWILLKAHCSEDIEVSEYLINNSPKAQEYSDLLRNIDAGEFDHGSEIITLNEMRSDTQVHNINSELVINTSSEIDWVIIEDKVFDITGLRHPKGNYILKAIKFHDITREIYGLKGWRFSSDDYVKVSKHRHVARTFDFLKQHCIGELLPSGLIVSGTGSSKMSMSESESTLNLFDSKMNMMDNARPKRIKSWLSIESYDITDKSSVMFLQKIEKDHAINISSFWLKNFGKYFFLRNDSNIDDYYYITLSLAPAYIDARQTWLNSLNYSFIRTLQSGSANLFKDFVDLNKQLLQMAGPDYTRFLQGADDLRFPYMPLFNYKPDHKKSVFNNKKPLRMNGPLGLGMGFEPSSTKKILIMAQDAGILPFTDFLEYIGQRALIELDEFKTPHPIFGKEYMLYYINEISIWIYWEISEEFWKEAQVLGLFGLEILNAVAKQNRFARDADQGIRDFTKIVNVLDKVHIVSNQGSKIDNKLIYTSQKASNFEEIVKTVVMENAGVINRVIASGDMKFIDRVLKKTNLPQNQIFIL